MLCQEPRFSQILIESALSRAEAKATAAQVAPPLDLQVTMRRDSSGTNGRATNPERLFSAAWAAFFPGMLRVPLRTNYEQRKNDSNTDIR